MIHLMRSLKNRIYSNNHSYCSNSKSTRRRHLSIDDNRYSSCSSSLDIGFHVIFYLSILAIVASYTFGVEYVLPQVLIATVTASLSDSLLRFTKTGEWLFSKGAVISGLIIALTMTRGQIWYVPATAATIAIISKHLITRQGRNVFNPSALSIAVTSFIFPIDLYLRHSAHLEGGASLYFASSYLQLDRWATLFLCRHGWIGSISSIGVVLLGLITAYEVKRHISALSFLTAYILLFMQFAFVTNQDVIIRVSLEIFASGALFFAFFMVTDPPTSAATRRGQLIYGVAVAVTAFILRLTLPLVASPLPCNSLLFALIILNLFAPSIDRKIFAVRVSL